MRTTNLRHRSSGLAQQLLGLLALVMTIVWWAPEPSFAADCTFVSITPARRCGGLGIPYYWGPGLNGDCSSTTFEGRECIQWSAAVLAAVQEINLTAALELGAPYYLYFAGTYVQGTLAPDGAIIGVGPLGAVGCSPSEGTAPIAVTMPFYTSQLGGNLRALSRTVTVFNSNAPWGSGGYDRTSVVRHELMHAMGVAHSGDGTCLMHTNFGCNEVRTLDNTALLPLICLYGDMFGDGCSNRYGFAVEDQGVNGLIYSFRRGVCNCSGGGCPSGLAQDQTAGTTALSYEFAVSESGGPYAVLTTAAEGDFVNNAYTYTFTQSYQSAMLRMRVLSGATQVGEAYITNPIAVSNTTGVRVPPSATHSFGLRAAPNPFRSELAIAFTLPTEAAVEVSVYDVTGRRVASLHSGMLGAGDQMIPWDGRIEGAPAASGYYRCVLRAGGRTTSTTMIRLH